MKRLTILLAAIAVATLPACEGFTVTGSVDIPNPVGGKEPIGRINISRTWYGKVKQEVVPPLPVEGKEPAPTPPE